jgi:hypothetical protein
MNVLGSMHKVEDRLKRPKVGPLYGPVIGLTITDIRTSLSGEKTPVVRSSGHSPAERPAILQARKACSVEKFVLFPREFQAVTVQS